MRADSLNPPQIQPQIQPQPQKLTNDLKFSDRGQNDGWIKRLNLPHTTVARLGVSVALLKPEGEV